MNFFIEERSLKTFMELPITHREEDDSFCSVYYDSCTADVLYRVECIITLDGEDVYTDTNLFKLEHYQSGNREWQWFAGSDWEQGPGEDIFDIEDVIHK